MTNLIFVAVLVTLGYFFGNRAEKKHFKSLQERELLMNKSVAAMASRIPPQNRKYDHILVSVSVVIANDYFKTFVAGLRNLIGGKVNSYESLLDRARREALLRMKEEAEGLNADFIFNVKYETVNISGQGTKKPPAIEAHAYGTALIKLDRDTMHN